MIPLRPAHGAEKDRIGVFAGDKGFCRQRIPFGVNGGASDKGVFVRESMAETPGHSIKRLDGFLNDFRSDAVTGEETNVFIHGVPLLG
jgi:hypothetical protein